MGKRIALIKEENTLLNPPSKEEADRRHYIRLWFGSLGVPANAIRAEYQTSKNGAVDLYLTNRRVIIEVKKGGRLRNGPHAKGTGSRIGESAFEQLERYVNDERFREKFHLEDDVSEDTKWIGAVTDGLTWWLWTWEPESDVIKDTKPITGWNGTRINQNNLKELEKIINREKIGKEWATADMAGEFESVQEELVDMYGRLKDIRATKTQKGLWLEQLKGSGNAPPPNKTDEMFVLHTMLILISRMITYSITKTHKDKITEGFVQWVDITKLDQLCAIMERYNWRQYTGDILRKIYEVYIRKEHRKIYGEYYTPDWLAECLCEIVIDDDFIEEQIENFLSGKPVLCTLDPSCGSGTFLYHSVKRIIDSKSVIDSGMSQDEKVKFVCKMVRGIDIHPVAVEMSRANIHRLLPNAMDSDIVVYQGDSLLTQRPESSLFGYGGENLPLVSPGKRHLILPSWFIKSSRDVSMFVETAKNDNGMAKGLGSSLDGYDHDALLEAHNQLREIIREESNGVWKWYILNQSGPMNLRGQAGRIVSNPPWVRYNKIQVESRKREVKIMAKDLKLWAGGNVSTSFDIASLFVDRCTTLYINKNTGKKTGWVIPHGSIKGEAWEEFRKKLGSNITARWDLGRLPFPNTPTCVTFFNINLKSGMFKKHKRKKINHYDTWSIASAKMEFDKPAHVFPDQRSWWLNDRQKAIARQGATIVPYCLTWVDSIVKKNGKNVEINTRKSTKPPWSKLGTINGSIPPKWIKDCISTHNIMSYILPTTIKCIIPLSRNDWDSNRNKNKFWKDAYDLYSIKCGKGKSTPKTLEKQMNYSNKLFKQFERRGEYIVYNTSGNNLYAARIKNIKHIVLSQLYAVPCTSKNEALFLIALLNSDSMLPALKAARKSDRHFHTHIWYKIPIPRYDPSNIIHKKLVVLGNKGERIALATYDKNATLTTNRNNIRKALREKNISPQIDEQCRILMPNHTV